MKMCSKCGFIGADEFFRDIGVRCKKCINIYRKEYRKKNKEKVEKQRKEYRKKNKEKLSRQGYEYNSKNKVILAKKRKVYYLKNKIEIDNIIKKRNKKRSKNIDDSYVKGLLIEGTSLKWADIPQELIELKREQIRLHRELRQK